MNIDKLPIKRALGVHWCIESDAFKFTIELKDKPCTRKGILATIGTIFDPLRLIAHDVLVRKQILQEVFDGKGWDEPIDGGVLAKWESEGVSYRYLSSSATQETLNLLILEELSLRSYITFQTHHKLDTDNVLISDWLTARFIVL